MMRTRTKLHHKNQDGYAMMATMMILVLLTVIGIAATNTSNVEVQIASNSKEIVEDFYVSEGSVVWGLENNNWLGLPLEMLGDKIFYNETVTDYTPGGWFSDVDFDGDGENDALVEARIIVDQATTIPGLTDSGNDVPVQRFHGPPPVNKGYSVDFIVRRFSVTATSLRGGTDVQAGTFKVYNNPDA